MDSERAAEMQEKDCKVMDTREGESTRVCPSVSNEREPSREMEG